MVNGTEDQTYKDLLLFLSAAAVMVPLFTRLNISPVLGFLVAGVILGPFGLGALAHSAPWISAVSITSVDEIKPLAELGVALLLFMIGLELSWERLLLMRRLVFGMGLLQVAVCSLVLGAVLWVLGQSPAAATMLGAALALSSTALVLPSLAERKRLNSVAGRASFSVLLFQDLAVAPLLFMVTLLGVPENQGAGPSAIAAVAIPAVVLVGVVVIGRIALRPLFRLAASTKSNELFVAASLLVVVGTGLITAASGQSMALGAFIAGLLLAETEYRRQVEVTIQPFQGLLLGLFFVSVGAGLDLSHLYEHPLIIIGLGLGLIVVKAALIVPAARLFGLPMSVAAQVALQLGSGGEFALVVLRSAIAAGVVPATSGATAMVAATLSMFAIPLLVRISERLSIRRDDDPALAALAPPLHDGPPRVLIVGYGRVGDLVGQMLTRHNIPFIAIDSDPGLVARERKRGKSIYYGEATQVEMLRRCGIARTPALVVTMDQPAAVESVVAAVRAERPELSIIARARDAAHAAKLYSLKVTDAVPETIEASLQLSEAVLVDIGVPMGAVIASIHEKRDEFRRALGGSGEQAYERRAIRVSTRSKHKND
jgi:CPA2 family monovalent cation:H+ antiporter-2